MFLSHVNRSLPVTIAAAAMVCLAGQTASASTVTYIASGTFSMTIVSGSDTFKLAGQPFSISIAAPEGAVPVKTGAHWAQYNKLTLNGWVDSGLLPTPVVLNSTSTVVTLATGNPNYDQLSLAFPFKSVGTTFTIKATIKAPKGTLTGTAIAPLTAPVTLNSSNNTMSYSYSANGVPNSTTLTIGTGTLSSTVSGQEPAQ